MNADELGTGQRWVSEPTLAERFLGDPRVRQARSQLLSVLAEYQAGLTSVRQADPALRADYEQLLDQFSELRGGALYYPYLGSGLGNVALVELADGSVKYDLIGGIGVHGLGHSHPELVAASLDAALRDLVMQGNLQQNVESVQVSRLLVEMACQQGAKLVHCFLSTSGAMANENALKMVFQKHYPADRLLAFEGCFMGRTLALAQVTDRAAYREGLPQTLAVDYVPFFKAQSPQASTEQALATLRRHLGRYPGQHAAMCFELVQGEGGYYPGDRPFFVALMRELKRRGVAVVVDEVQTFGRTSQPFAFQHFGLDEYVDVVTVGKLTQLCATLFTEEYRPRPGLISQTFTAATASIFAARAILTRLRRGDFFGPQGRVAQIHQRFVERLEGIGQRHPGWVQGPYGIGAMIGFQVFDGSAELTRRVLRELFDAGVIAFQAGANPARVRFLPPVGAIRDKDIDAACDILEQTLARVVAAASPGA
ncbi:MAG TPA: aminotransferase class III-fold pyridoxal phosphate-dependent enzyme [Phycisphaeraceae bacterium]